MDNWQYHNSKMIELKKTYNKIDKQKQLELQTIFNTFNFSFEELYNIASKKTKDMIDIKISEWQDKGLLKNYFGMLANNIYKRTRIKNSEILELLIYGAYIEEQSKLEENEKQIIYNDMNYYYQEEQEEVNKTQKSKKPISVLDMALFLYLLEQPNYSGLNLQKYIDVMTQNNAQQMYRQALINIQQQRDLDISLNEFQRIITQQNNQKLCINDNKISGFMDMYMIGLNNQSKVQGIIEVIRKQLGKTKEQIKNLLNKNKEIDIKVRFIAVEDDRTTSMCDSLNEQIFSINKVNKFTRYYGDTAKTLKKKHFKIKGLVPGINLPPIIGHFHYCRSTITYQIDMPREELNKMLNMEYRDITNRILNRDKKEYKVEEQNYYKDDNGSKYEVDGKYVIMKPTKNEKQVANLLGELYGGKVKIIPRINVPENIKTPDYMIGNKKYDLKEIKGNGKYVIQGNLKGKSQQADNFVIDISKSKIQEIDAIEQIQSIYKSKHYLWIDELILIKNNQILKMYKRK